MELRLLIARLYFDEDADVRLAEALRQRGYDVQTTVEAGLLEASDEEQLAYAVSQQRALVTHNSDKERGRRGDKETRDMMEALQTATLLVPPSPCPPVSSGCLAAPDGESAEPLLSRGAPESVAVPGRRV